MVVPDRLGRLDQEGRLQIQVAGIPDLTPALARAYATRTAKTLTRDRNWLRTRGLLHRTPKATAPESTACTPSTQPPPTHSSQRCNVWRVDRRPLEDVIIDGGS